MKTPEQLKKELHEYIDRIDDEETLMMVLENMVIYFNYPSVTDASKKEDYLTEEQQKDLEEAITQADAGEIVSEEEYLKATARWRIK